MKRCGSFFFLLVSVLLSATSSFAQQSRVDSLARQIKIRVTPSLYNEMSSAYIGFNPDSAEVYAKKALELSRQTKNKKEEAIALKMLGLSLSRKGKGKTAIPLYLEGIKIAREENFNEEEGDLIHSLGIAYYNIAQYDSALTKYFIALDIFKKLNDKKKIAGMLNSIGNVYYFKKKNKEAKEFYLEAMDIYRSQLDYAGLAKEYGNIGLVYSKENDSLKAVEYSIKSLEYNLKTEDRIGIATSYVNLGYAYEKAGEFKKAIENVEKSLEIRKEIGDKKGIAICIVTLGAIYSQNKDFPKAEKFYKQGLKLCREMNLRTYELETLEGLSGIYKEIGKLKEANEMYVEIIELKDSLAAEISKVSNEKIAEFETQYKAEMEALYQTKQKDNEIKLLTQEAEIQNLSLKRRSTYLWAAAGFIVLLWVILGVSYNAYRNKQKSNSLLEKKNNEITRQKQEITDSIHYAQTIQRAILPPEKMLQNYLPDSFVIFKPKDIVSGDFYWTLKTAAVGSGSQTLPTTTANSQLVYFAAVDCTGHGVPGAFMSIIGHNSLNRAVKDFKLTHPAQILDKLVELVTEALRAENQAEVKDGMDIALCCLDTQQLRLEYAGAYNPLYVIRKGEVIEYKADRQPIGSFENRKPFTNHVIELEKGDCIYVSSDGVADQFGGEKGKKLGTKRLKEWLLSTAHLPAAEQYTQLTTRFTAWQGKEEQTDDVTLIGVRV